MVGVRREISDLMRNGWKKGYGIFKLSFKRLKSYKRIDIFFVWITAKRETNKQKTPNNTDMYFRKKS